MNNGGGKIGGKSICSESRYSIESRVIGLTLQENLIVRDLGDGDSSDLELLGLSSRNDDQDDDQGRGAKRGGSAIANRTRGHSTVFDQKTHSGVEDRVHLGRVVGHFEKEVVFLVL